MAELTTVELEKPAWKVKRVYRGDGVAFIPHPHIHGAWVKVHPCVVDVSCPYCDSPAGALCLGTRGKYTVAHHVDRAEEWHAAGAAAASGGEERRDG